MMRMGPPQQGHGSRWVFLEGLMDLHCGGELAFFGDLTGLAGADAFARWLAPFRKSEWVVYAKPPCRTTKSRDLWIARTAC